MLTYRRFKGLEIIRYYDSDFARCQDTKHSMFGYIYVLAGGAIFFKSIKQTCVTPSTMAIEFVACFETSNHKIWLRNFVTSLWVVLYSNNNRSSKKSKFIDIKFLVVKKRIQNR
ncbi:hypothetical protein CR513_44370, partial [Mucuna pruriens]